MYEIVNVTPTPIKQLCADVPDRLANIIDRMLEKQPENRFQNSQEIVTELTELGKLIDAGGDLRGSKSSITLHLPSFLQKRSARLMAIAFLVILIPCIWYIYNHRKSSPAEMDRSIAVLPLLNVGDTTNAYLAGGLTDDIIMDFSRLPQAMLIFAEKTAAGGHPQMADSAIASNLGVRYLLKGEAQFSRSMAKLHASIYDHRADKEIWSTDYEQPRTGLFDMKRTLIADVASQLGISSPAPSSRLHTPSPEVYESYLHGLSDRDRTTKEDMRMAREYLREAVSKDSLYVDGLVRLARSLVESNVSGWDKSPSGLTEAAALCRKALQLDSTNAEAYGVLGYIIEKSDDRDKGIAYLQKCLELDKSSSFALTALGIIYMSELNEPAKGVVYLKRLQELQPTDWLIAQNLGVGYGQLKDYAGAKTAFRRAMQLNPDHEWPMMNMGYVCERLGDLDSALSYYLLALQKHNKSLPVYENFSSVSLAMKKYQLAESTLAIGTRAMPGEYMMNYWLGVAYSLDSKQQAADAAFKEGVLIIKTKLGSNLEASECHSDLALFYARLKNEPEALKELAISMKLDSSMFIKAAQIYAVLGMKDKMLLSFRKARQMSPEWDDAFLATAIDFANYRNDPDLLALAREE
jgi:Flp pilus assembly protein TadD/TolB-like protein